MRRRTRPRLEVLEDRLTPSGDVLVLGSTSSSFVSLTSSQPSGGLIVQLQDGNGNAVSATSNLTVDLSSSSSTGQFLDLSGKALSNSSVTISSGSSFALFEYEDSHTGDPTITAKTSDNSASGNMFLNVHNTLAFTPPIQAVAPNQASGTITVQVQDGQGNAIKVASDTTINLSSSSSTGKFHDTSGKPLSSPSITIAAGFSWSGLGHFGDTVRQAYRKDFCASLDHHVEVFVEKDAIAGTIQPVIEEYDIRLRVCRGYSSVSFGRQIYPDLRNTTNQAFGPTSLKVKSFR
jgi:hypothetical protein